MFGFAYVVVNKSRTCVMEPVSFKVARNALDDLAKVLSECLH